MKYFLEKLFSRLKAKRRNQYIAKLVSNGLHLGKNVEIIETFFFDPSHCYLIHIGDNCTICPNVRLIAHDASTKRILGYTKIGRIEIGSSCFLGDSVIVLPNVKIGSNVIIGSGSIVTSDIPADCVAAGNPARVLFKIDDYIKKIQKMGEGKHIFSTDYHISHLTHKKRKEILNSLQDSIGFIV